MSEPVSVAARDLSRTFGAFRAVEGVTFTVRPGEIFGFLGSNGAGKTTTIRMLCGLLAPSSGAASVAGFDVATQGDEIKRRVGYMSQRFSLYVDLTVDENLRFWGGAYGLHGRVLAARQEWALTMSGLIERRGVLVRELPGGFRQRLALGTALLHQPPVVFLDEPTGGVDPRARRDFWDVIDELAFSGTTVFVTTHSMDEAERCHRVALMHAGRLIALDTPANLKEVFLPGTVLEVRCTHRLPVMAALEAVAGVKEVSLFGDAVHVILATPEALPQVKTALAGCGDVEAAVYPIEPTLEDVFISAIGAAVGRAA